MTKPYLVVAALPGTAPLLLQSQVVMLDHSPQNASELTEVTKAAFPYGAIFMSCAELLARQSPGDEYSVSAVVVMSDGSHRAVQRQLDFGHRDVTTLERVRHAEGCLARSVDGVSATLTSCLLMKRVSRLE